MSLALEFESKINHWECFRCGNKYGPGHRCKTGTFKLLEANDVEEPTDTQEVNLDENPSEVAEISLHAIFAPFGVQIGNGDVIRCSKVCRDFLLQLGGLKVVQDFYPFFIGEADLVLGIQWLATLNTVQANWKEMFMIFTIDRKQYKLQGVSTGPHKSSSFQHLAIEPDINLDIPDSLKPIITKYNAIFDEPRNLPPLRSRTYSIPLRPSKGLVVAATDMKKWNQVIPITTADHSRPFNKIEFPVFSGGDPRGWILKAEKYFRFYNTLDEEKVNVAAMHLEGDALDLYSWMSAEHDISYWEELINILQKHFGPPEFQNPDEYLCSIKQTGSVHEYRQEFARRSARISNWTDHCLLGVFLNGLKDKLKANVRIHKPRTVYKAMSLALEFESKINHSRPEKKTTWNSQLKPESKPFTPWERFRCGDKYGPGHRCKTGTFKLLEADDVEEPTDTQKVNLDENPSEVAEINLHAIFGKSQPTTMKVHGTLNSNEVLILIDGGSTHNFIPDVLVNELKLISQMVAPFGVQIGNGDGIRCSKVCRDLSLQLGGLKVVQDFYPFFIGEADLVLGIQWLATLNTVQANWKEMFMIFTIDRI
nr:retrotransposon Gag domain, retroviral aspartyl protease [Tanacetum cinerariifolium]